MAQNRLTQAGFFHLAALVRDEYTSSQKDDEEFALYAKEKLQLPVIRRDQIARARKVFNIKNNLRAAATEGKTGKLAQLSQNLEALTSLVNEQALQIAALQKDLRRLIGNIGGVR